jgi:hypothetical protein
VPTIAGTRTDIFFPWIVYTAHATTPPNTRRFPASSSAPAAPAGGRVTRATPATDSATPAARARVNDSPRNTRDRATVTAGMPPTISAALPADV